MKNLIKKILKEEEGFKDSTEEDWEWANDVPTGELGDSFNEDDIVFEDDDDDYKINLFSDHVIYNLKMDVFKDYIGDHHDDWCLDVLLSHEGGYEGGDSDAMDSEEINYIGWHLTDGQRDRLQEILNNPRVRNAVKKSLDDDNLESRTSMGWQQKHEMEELHNLREINYNVSQMVTDQRFGLVGSALNLIYKGRGDWEDFSNNALWAMGSTLDRNRWTTMNNSYNNHLEERGIEIEHTNGYYSRNGGELKITVPFPFRGEYNLSDILPSLELDAGWSDWFYDDYNTEGSEDDIQFYFESLLDKMEEVLEDEDFE